MVLLHESKIPVSNTSKTELWKMVTGTLSRQNMLVHPQKSTLAETFVDLHRRYSELLDVTGLGRNELALRFPRITSWNASSLQMGPIYCPEASVTKTNVRRATFRKSEYLKQQLPHGKTL